jgi:hypothetical protein
MRTTTLRLTGPQVAALQSALENYLDEDPDDTDAEAVLEALNVATSGGPSTVTPEYRAERAAEAEDYDGVKAVLVAGTDY